MCICYVNYFYVPYVCVSLYVFTVCVCVCELTHAFDSSVIQVVAEGTFTAEGAISVDTCTIFTWVIQTLIHICTREKDEVCYTGHMKVTTDDLVGQALDL